MVIVVNDQDGISGVVVLTITLTVADIKTVGHRRVQTKRDISEDILLHVIAAEGTVNPVVDAVQACITNALSQTFRTNLVRDRAVGANNAPQGLNREAELSLSYRYSRKHKAQKDQCYRKSFQSCHITLLLSTRGIHSVVSTQI
jgi:hypothetical protein